MSWEDNYIVNAAAKLVTKPYNQMISFTEQKWQYYGAPMVVLSLGVTMACMCDAGVIDRESYNKKANNIIAFSAAAIAMLCVLDKCGVLDYPDDEDTPQNDAENTQCESNLSVGDNTMPTN